MDFVDGDRFLEPIGLGALGDPSGVIPFVGVQIGDHGAGLRAQFGAKSVRISFKRDHVSAGADDFVFVDGSFVQFGDKKLPNSRGAASAHRIYTAVPMIEIADDADAAAAGRPDREIDAAHAFESLNVCAELIVGVVVAALAHQVQIELAEEEWEGVSVELLEGCARGKAILNAIGGWRGAILLSFGERGFKEAVGPELGCFDDTRRIKETNCRGNRAGMKRANDPAAACRRVDLVWTKQGERIGVAADDERVNGVS